MLIHEPFHFQGSPRNESGVEFQNESGGELRSESRAERSLELKVEWSSKQQKCEMGCPLIQMSYCFPLIPALVESNWLFLLPSSDDEGVFSYFCREKD